MKDLLASLPYDDKFCNFCRNTSKTYLVNSNKISLRENSANEFNLGCETSKFYANSTRFKDAFKLTGSARAKEKPKWVQRAQLSEESTNCYREICSDHCKFTAELEVKIAKEDLRINLYINMFVIAKGLANIKN